MWDEAVLATARERPRVEPEIVRLGRVHHTGRGALLAEADVHLLPGCPGSKGDVDVALEVLSIVDDVMVAVGSGDPCSERSILGG